MRAGLAGALAALTLCAQTADIRVDVDLVTVACSATDAHGIPVKNLAVGDFSVLDNGEPRPITQFWQEADLPLTIGLVVDASPSQAEYLARHRNTILQFLSQVLGPRDRAFLAQIDKQARLVTDLTASAEALRDGVATMGTREARQAPMLGGRCRGPWKTGCGGTALWHGLYFAAEKLRPIEGRKALIVLSDGMDTGSDRSVSDVIEAAQSAGAVVYAIKYESPARFLAPTLALWQALARGMERISRETGGLTFPDPKRNIAEVFSRIQAELRNMYVLGFVPPEETRDGKFHKLIVRSPRPQVAVRARAGYWAAGRPAGQD